MKQYSALAQTMKEKELSAIFVFMADQEERHYELFNSWQRSGTVSKELPGETVFGTASGSKTPNGATWMNINQMTTARLEQGFMQVF